MLRVILILLLLFSFPSSCLSQSKSVKVGFSLPLSGRLAYVGEDIRQGVLLALEEFSNDELQFQTIYEDNQHSAKLAVSSAKKLLNIDKVDVIVSLWDMADPVASIAERAQVPHLAIRWNPHITEKYEYTFTIESTYKSYINKLLELIRVQGANSIGILTEEGQGWILASDYLKKTAESYGISVVGDERYTNETSDHRGISLRLLKKKPDFVVLLSNPPHTEILTKRIREAKPVLPITGYFEYTESPELYEGVFFASQFSPASWFEEKFQERFGKAFKARAPQAYDIMKLIAHAQAKSPTKLTGREFVSGIRKSGGLPGASGVLNFSADRVIESECVWKTFTNGEIRVVQKSEVIGPAHG